MKLGSYFVKSLKTAFIISKIGIIKDKIFTKYHNYRDINNLSYKQIKSNYFTKFHRESYRNHILELANDLSADEQIISNEVNAENEIDYEIEEDIEDENLINVEDLIQPSEISNHSPNKPAESRLIKIIVRNGNVVEKIFLTSDNQKLNISV